MLDPLQRKFHQLLLLSFTISLTVIRLLSQGFTASSRVDRYGHITVHYRWMATEVVCPTSSPIAKIIHLNQEGVKKKKNRIRWVVVCNLLTSTGDILLNLPLKYTFAVSLTMPNNLCSIYIINVRMGQTFCVYVWPPLCRRALLELRKCRLLIHPSHSSPESSTALSRSISRHNTSEFLRIKFDLNEVDIKDKSVCHILLAYYHYVKR